jgi:hypothetical protein
MAVEKLTFEMNAVGNAVPEMKKVQSQLGNVSKQMQRSNVVMQRHANVNRSLQGSLKKTTRGMGMLGLQVQDVAVQASMGTDALRIFSMQGPQIFSIFGPLGMIAGAFAGVGAGILMASGGLERFTGVFDDIIPAFNNFTEKMGALINQFSPLVSFIGGAVSGAFQLMGGLIDFVSDNLEALTVAAGLFVAIKLAGVVLTTANNFVSLAKAVSASKILMFAFNKVVRRSPLALVALAAGLAADQLGLITKAMDELKAKFPEFFEAVKDAGGSVAELITTSFKAIDDAMRTPLKIKIEGDAEEKLNKIKSATEAAMKAASEYKKKVDSVGEAVSRSFESSFMSVIKGTKSVGDAFRTMAISIIEELFRIFVVKQITNFITGSIVPSLMVGPLQGPTMSGAPLSRFEGGGYTGRGARAGGMDGRGGFMAMLHPNETVVDHTRNGGGGVTVNQTINVTTGVQQTVRNEIQTLLPQIAEASKAAVLDARRRGGSFANAF